MARPDDSWPDGGDPDGSEPDGSEPDGSEPDGSEPDGSEPDGGERPGADGPVPDAEWEALVGELSGSAEARGTQDSFALPVDEEIRASAQADLTRLTGRPEDDADPVGDRQHLAARLPGDPGPAPGAWPGAEPEPGAGFGAAGPAAAEPPTELTQTGLVGSMIVRSAAGWWQRVTTAVDRWRHRPPASLALPSGSKARFTIGREADCDMTLLDRTVSRLHASLKREGDGWLLTDLGSTNGTRLNGWRVTTPITVAPGDRVSFGAATFVLTDRPR